MGTAHRLQYRALSCACVCGSVVQCGFVLAGIVILAHHWMAWWSAFIAKGLLLHTMIGASCKAHVGVFTLWIMRSMDVTVGWVR